MSRCRRSACRDAGGGVVGQLTHVGTLLLHDPASTAHRSGRQSGHSCARWYPSSPSCSRARVSAPGEVDVVVTVHRRADRKAELPRLPEERGGEFTVQVCRRHSGEALQGECDGVVIAPATGEAQRLLVTPPRFVEIPRLLGYVPELGRTEGGGVGEVGRSVERQCVPDSVGHCSCGGVAMACVFELSTATLDDTETVEAVDLNGRKGEFTSEIERGSMERRGSGEVAGAGRGRVRRAVCSSWRASPADCVPRSGRRAWPRAASASASRSAATSIRLYWSSVATRVETSPRSRNVSMATIACWRASVVVAAHRRHL